MIDASVYLSGAFYIAPVFFVFFFLFLFSWHLKLSGSLKIFFFFFFFGERKPENLKIVFGIL